MKDDYPGIELLRFVCALAVVLYHYQFYFGSLQHPARLGEWLLLPFYEYGMWAVNVFWMISGFIFYSQYAITLRQGSVRFFDFAVRRFSRLYPLHIVTLIIVAFGVSLASPDQWQYQLGWRALISQLLFASNWFEGQGYSYNGPIWSVSVEMLTYLLFFCVARKVGGSRRVASVIVISSGMAAWFFKNHPFNYFLDYQIFECATFFFTGGILQQFAPKPRRSNLSAFAFLGNATYSSYLIHFPLAMFAVIITERLGISRNVFLNPAFMATYLTSVFGLAFVVFHWFERPSQNWLRKIWRRILDRKESGPPSPQKREPTITCYSRPIR